MMSTAPCLRTGLRRQKTARHRFAYRRALGFHTALAIGQMLDGVRVGTGGVLEPCQLPKRLYDFGESVCFSWMYSASSLQMPKSSESSMLVVSTVTMSP